MIQSSLDMLPSLLAGATTTIYLTLISFPLAFLVALAAAFAGRVNLAPVRWITTAFIEVFRGTSLIIQLFYFYFVLPFVGITLEATTTAVLVLSLHYGAYGAEIVRAAISTVPRGQYEAASTLGLTPRLTMRLVVLPQALLIMIPPFGNVLIEMLKATSILSLITVSELAFAGNALFQTTGQTVQIYVLVLIIYFLIAYSLTLGVRRIERHLSVGRGLGLAP